MYSHFCLVKTKNLKLSIIGQNNENKCESFDMTEKK